ncbi:MAG: HEAT repeat domain-containing protein [Deltaproteobacteria bacterium]|nr:HEAT repeat domain-containing protein [Deltaproteobacteria bacterium]
MEGRFKDRKVVEKPMCPFCGSPIERPRELDTHMPNEMPVGMCSCGAVYACDVTGHNLGTAMIDALLFGCNGDWDLAWGLLPEEDYSEALIKGYDLEKHLVIEGRIYEGRRISGALFFIRFHQDIREVTEDGVKERMKRTRPALKESGRGPVKRKTFTKGQVENLVREGDMEGILGLAAQDKRIIRDLQRLTYTPDRLLRWRAAEALGKACAVIAREDPGAVSRLLERLFTALRDTAASSWGAIDAIGEIVGNSPERFAGFIPQLSQLTRDRDLLPEILRALCRIGGAIPESLRKRAFHYVPLLEDPSPEIRGLTAQLLGHMGAREARDHLVRLLEDTAEVEVYEEGLSSNKTIAQLASESLNRLKKLP